jgi:hypothetical protein
MSMRFMTPNDRHQGRRHPRQQSKTTPIGVPWMPRLAGGYSHRERVVVVKAT